jgi:hypothetical protein
MDETMQTVFYSILSALFLIAARYLIPWLKSKMSAEAFNFMRDAFRTAVWAAEQLFPEPGSGVEKKAYATGLLKSQGYDPESPEGDALLEAEVKKLPD